MEHSPKSVFEKICDLLGTHDVRYRTVEHVPTYTSEESAAARGEELQTGGKALFVKVDENFALFVLPANQRLDSKLARQALSCKKLRFATKEELFDCTGLVPGSVPPFGEPIFHYPLYADASLLENSKIAFNAGSLTNSVILSMEDYRRVAKPQIGHFIA